jgi:nitrate/nitrite-specific signal transduction histidine kinase
MAEKDQEKSDSFTQEDFNLFYEVSTSIHAIRDLDEMLGSILRKIKAIFNIEGASLALHDQDRKELYFIRTGDEKNAVSEPPGRGGMGVEAKRARYHSGCFQG